MRTGITGDFRVQRKKNGRREVEFCAERGLYVGSTYFENRSLQKYTRVTMDEDGVEVKSMIDLVLVKKDMLHYVEDVRAVRGMG